MSDTTGNGNLSPRAAEAVRSGLEQLNFVVDELEASKQESRELRTQIAGYKVAMEAFEARVAELESRERTAMLERDQAVADRITWETLFVSINAQMRAFKIPSAPFVKDQSEEAIVRWRSKLSKQTARSMLNRITIPFRFSIIWLIASLAWIGISSAESATVSNTRCLTRKEARSVYPRAYLYWRSDGGRRCWSDRRVK